MQGKFGLAHFWAQGDAVAIVMLPMSVASWTIIIGKAIGHFRNRHSVSLAMQSFWDADSRAQALDAEISIDALGARLQAGSMPATEMHLRADRGTRYERVTEVMAAAQRVGITRIAFVTEAPR